MPTLRIALYHATLPASRGKKGGVEAAVHRLGQALARRGKVDVTVFSSGQPPEDARYKHRKILDRTNGRKFSRLLISPLLMNRIDFSGFDAVHFHGDDWFYVRRPVPVVRTFHGSALHEARTATSRKRKLMQGLVYQFERLSSKLATRSISVGKETQALYGCEYNIGNSVDLSLFAPREKTAFPSLIFVGTWSGRKRGQFVYKAFVEKVLPAYPDAKLYFVADHCDPHPSVVYMSKVSDAELAEAIAKSWVFAYPSAYEGFGIPYIEAMASGTAIVTSPNPGANEVLEDGRYGIISEDADFGDNVLRIIRDDRLRAEFVAAGLDHAQAFGEDQITAQIEAVYEETVRAGK